MFLESAYKRSWFTQHGRRIRTIEISVGVSASLPSNQLAAHVGIELTQTRRVVRWTLKYRADAIQPVLPAYTISIHHGVINVNLLLWSQLVQMHLQLYEYSNIEKYLHHQCLILWSKHSVANLIVTQTLHLQLRATQLDACCVTRTLCLQLHATQLDACCMIQTLRLQLRATQLDACCVTQTLHLHLRATQLNAYCVTVKGWPWRRCWADQTDSVQQWTCQPVNSSTVSHAACIASNKHPVDNNVR